MRKDKNIYVVELDDSVRRNRKFLSLNPDNNLDLPCLYVGRTGHSPEKRFSNHKSGYKASRIVKKYGIRLVPELYSHLNPMTFNESEKMEIELARRLRSQGFAVWQK